MKCTILGCGGSLGVPQLLCDCGVCTSAEPKNNRTRSSILIETKDTTLLIDASPDFRNQAFSNKIRRIDGALITHVHSDHISGIDDLKPFTKINEGLTPVYMNKASYESLGTWFGYLFDKKPGSVYNPIFEKCIFNDYDTIQFKDLRVQTFQQGHGDITSIGIRIGDFAYSTDLNFLSDEALSILKGVKIWVIDCLRYHHAPTHLVYEQTLDYIGKIKPNMAYLTHMAHEIDYSEISRIMPPNIRPAYDGLIINF